MSSTFTSGLSKYGKRHGLLLHTLSISLLAAFVFILSLLNGTWDGYPKGIDAAGHMSKIQFVAEFWPKSNWANIWYDGTPLFKWYGPVPEHLAAFFIKATGFPTELSVALIFVLSIAITGIMVYLAVFSVTGTRSSSFLSALLMTSSSFLWTLGIVGGLYARTTTTAIFSVAIYYLSQFAKQACEGRVKRPTLACLVTFLSLTVVSHPAMALLGLLAPLFVCALLPLKISQRLKKLAEVFVPTASLSIWFMGPAIYNAPATITGPAVSSLQIPTDLSHVKYVIYILTGVPIVESSKVELGSLSPVMIPLLVVLIIAAWGLGRRRKKPVLSSVIVSSLLLTSTAAVAYALNGSLGIALALPNLFFLLLSLSIVCGVLFQYASQIFTSDREISPVRRVTTKGLTVLLLLCIIFISSFLQYPFSAGHPISPSVRSRSPYFAQNVVSDLLVNGTAIPNYRIGVPDDALAWVNRKYPAVPETRGYYAQGVLNPDWLYWFEVGAWHDAPPQEVNFLFDWSAVKWFVLYPPLNQTRFTSIPQFYDVIVSDHGAYGFVYKYATPIVSATSAPSSLVIAKYPGPYTEILHSLSYSDYDSRYVIPIIGHEYIDDYDLSELMRYDAIILYGHRYHDQAKAYGLLNDYVTNGGGLLIETGYSPEGPPADLPLPSPVNSTLGLAPGPTWGFSSASSPVIEGTNLSSFSPAKYGDGSWGVSASSNSTVRSWAKTVLWTEGHPIVVAGEYGKGRVVWSGLNLPLHVAMYKNVEESQFLARMIGWVTKRGQDESPNAEYAVERPNPENVVIRITNRASKVLFKEFYTENWHATAFDSRMSGGEVPIYRAGPGFMFVELPDGLEYPVEVHFEYQATVLENTSNLVSAITLVSLAFYAITPRLFDRVREASRRRKQAIVEQVSAHWQEEE